MPTCFRSALASLSNGVAGTAPGGPSSANAVALRRFAGLSQEGFAGALGICVDTLRSWVQGRRQPQGAAIALLRIAAQDPHIVRVNVASAASPKEAQERALLRVARPAPTASQKHRRVVADER